MSGPPPLVDTHAHLDDEKFRDDLPAVLDRARAAGVGRVITIATTAPTSANSVALAARHLELARRHNLAVVIHCRDAEADVVRMLREDFDRHGPVRGVMHSFTGSAQTAKSCLEMGLYLSFAGMVTYKNAQALRDVAASVPLDRLLVETDSPYLAPVPVRGQRNEPAFVAHTAACLAGLLGIDLDALAGHTTANARALFGLPV